MSSSAEILRLDRVPTGVVVHQGSAEEALEAIFERRVAARERAAAEAVRAELGRALAAAAQGFATEQERLTEELSRTAIELGCEIARGILRVELDAGNYELERVIRECLALGTEGRGAATVHLSPTDAARMDDMAVRAGTELVADGEVANGEVRVESSLGQVVRDPSECVERVREALTEELGR